MIGTLTTAPGGTSFGFLDDARSSDFISTGKVSFRCKALFHAVTADSVVDLTARRRSSLYEVLQVKRNATPNEIKTAYRNLAKVYHPDASDLKKHEEGNFIEIHDAYATLYDPAARAVYDLKLSTGIGRRSGPYTAAGKRYAARRWETDQCW